MRQRPNPKRDFERVVEETPEWVKQFMKPHGLVDARECDLVTCGAMFEARDGFNTDLPKHEKLRFCSTLCAYRHKKAALAERGIMLK